MSGVRTIRQIHGCRESTTGLSCTFVTLSISPFIKRCRRSRRNLMKASVEGVSLSRSLSTYTSTPALNTRQAITIESMAIHVPVWWEKRWRGAGGGGGRERENGPYRKWLRISPNGSRWVDGWVDDERKDVEWMEGTENDWVGRWVKAAELKIAGVNEGLIKIAKRKLCFRNYHDSNLFDDFFVYASFNYRLCKNTYVAWSTIVIWI